MADHPKLEIQLLLDRVLVKISPEDGERRSTGGIVIPATAQVAKRLSWGDVLGVGNNVRMVKV
ncbi:MAG TPA: co-chaperone GroES, partial [Pseudonocardiaceae bacterium]